MRATIPQPKLLKGLQAIERAVNDRSAMPILATVLVEAKGQGMRMAATDLDVGIQYHLPLGEAVEEGAIALPARRLSTLVRELPDEPVTLESKKNHTATLVCGTSQFRLPGLPAEDFPIFPSYEPSAQAVLPEASLKSLITHTAFAMSMEETRFVLNGAQLNIREATATLVATDGRRLALARTQLSQPVSAPLGVILPAKTIRELGRLLQDESAESVSIIPLKDNQLVFQFSDVAITTRLVEGQFPAYDAVIPAPASTTLTCSRQLLANAVRRASLMTTATSQAVLFELSDQRLTISKETAELGSAREELPAVYRGPAMTVAFNPEFWLDVLKVLEGEELTVEIVSPEKPAVVRLPEFLYVVLPMKLA